MTYEASNATELDARDVLSQTDAESSLTHAVLKSATRPWHDRTEAAVPWELGFSSESAYRELLLGWLRLIAPAEDAIQRCFPKRPAVLPEPGTMTSWLEQDLRILSEGSGRFEVPEEREPADFSLVRTPAMAAGCAYVLMGSMLGGRVLSRELSRRLNIQADTGGRYFSGLGTGTPQRWGDFVSWLNSTIVSAGDQQAAVEGAILTFERFLAVFCGRFHDRLLTILHRTS